MTRNKSRCHLKIAQALLVLLLVAQSLLALNACAYAAMNVSMPFTEAQMPEECAGMNKQACLMFYLQSDQVPSSSHLYGAVFHPDVTVWTVGTPQPGAARVAVLAASSERLRTRPPPPHILFCRLLR